MKTAICYQSCHHGNTRKPVGYVAKGHPDAVALENARRFYRKIQSLVAGEEEK